jgi:hypothetical protein
MGKAAEYLVASTCIIASRAMLNVATSLVDDEGIDLVFNRRDSAATLSVQVKARFSDAETIRRGIYIQNVRSQTLAPSHDLYVLFVLVDVAPTAIRVAWLVPSKALATGAHLDSLSRYRFSASVKPGSRDKWSPYRLDPSDLASEVLRALDSVAD